MLINPELTKIIAFFMVFFQRLSTITFFDIIAKIYEGEEDMIEKLTLRTRAYILTDKRFENFISSPGDWFYAEKDDEKVIVFVYDFH